jgi:hypothetical protein
MASAVAAPATRTGLVGKADEQRYSGDELDGRQDSGGDGVGKKPGESSIVLHRSAGPEVERCEHEIRQRAAR